jgi:hypothetical protein
LTAERSSKIPSSPVAGTSRYCEPRPQLCRALALTRNETQEVDTGQNCAALGSPAGSHKYSVTLEEFSGLGNQATNAEVALSAGHSRDSLGTFETTMERPADNVTMARKEAFISVIFKTHRRRTLVQSVPDAALQDWIAWRQFSPSHTSRRIAYSVEQVVAARVSAGPLGRLCINPVLATCHGNCDERDRRASRPKGGLRRRPRLFRSPRSPAPRIRRIRQGREVSA